MAVNELATYLIYRKQELRKQLQGWMGGWMENSLVVKYLSNTHNLDLASYFFEMKAKSCEPTQWGEGGCGAWHLFYRISTMALKLVLSVACGVND